MKINYLLEGDGDKTIVFIHGLSDSLLYWLPLTSVLKSDYMVLSYDLRGHGESELGFDEFTVDLLSDDLHNLLNDLGIDEASLIGLSLGGNVALNFALNYPDFTDKLVLMSTFSEVDDELHEKFLEFRDAIDVSFEEFYDVIINYVLPDEMIEKHKGDLEFIKMEAAKTANLKAIKNAIDMGMEFNVTSRLSEIDSPALILSGRDDEITSVELQRILNDNIDDSEMVIFENTRHNLLIGQNIEEILKLIRGFV
ncbi:alpha/beta fold hydrolase [Methanobrevibacter millerae]|uniref:Pimeloyl-ACP methyl ester carboxylesterase n=1 Tax=Methanobrevibacter millerae TaxID=230361 RepID=A0A1G5WIM8_9EURY|nr:alpha/beta hydrolase [Methanobrevibacter millerae]SDA58038.1 Pimeloyl-ACP methyl ester carboxylesterase [Methanobrevibacter millerae]